MWWRCGAGSGQLAQFAQGHGYRGQVGGLGRDQGQQLVDPPDRGRVALAPLREFFVARQQAERDLAGNGIDVVACAAACLGLPQCLGRQPGDLGAPAREAEFGIDITSPQFWRDSLAVIEDQVVRFEKMNVM